MKISLTTKGMLTAITTLYSHGLSCEEIGILKEGKSIDADPSGLAVLSEHGMIGEAIEIKLKKAEVEDGSDDL